MKSFTPFLLVLASSFPLILAQSATASSSGPAPTVDETCWNKNQCTAWGNSVEAHCKAEADVLGLNNFDFNNPADINFSNTADIQNFFNCACNEPSIIDPWEKCFSCEKNLPPNIQDFVNKINDPRCKSALTGSASPSPAATGSGNSSPSASAGGSGSPSKASGSGGGGSGPSPSPTASAGSGGSGGKNSSSSGSGGNGTSGGSPKSTTSASGAGSIICSMALLGGIVIAGGMLLV